MPDAAMDVDEDVTTIRPSGGAPSNAADRFQIRAVLGDGHAGMLFRAYDRALGRLVILRLLDPTIAGNPVRYEQVQDAVRRMASIVDPNIVEIYSLISDAVPPVIVSECVDGPSAAQLVATTGPMRVNAGLVVLDGTLAGLEHLHGIGLVHGSLTPSSVLVDASGDSKIADVGLAYSEPIPNQARPFLAPEVQAGRRPETTADVFSAGALLCLLMTGRAPMIATGSGGAGAGGPLGMAALPTPVRQLISDAMASDPAARLSDLTKFRERLEVAASASCGPEWRRVGAAALAGAAASALAMTEIPDAMTAATALFTGAQVTSGGAGTVATGGPAAATAVSAGPAGPGSSGLIPGLRAEPYAQATGFPAATAPSVVSPASAMGAGGSASGGILASIGAHPVAAGIVAAVVVASGATAAYIGARGGPSPAPAAVASASPTVAPLATGSATPAASPSASTPPMVPVCRGISNCKVVAADVDVDGDGKSDQVGIAKAGTSGPAGDAGYINWTVRVSTAVGQQASITKPAKSTPMGRSDMTPRDYTPWFGATNLDGRPGQELVTRNGDYEAFSTWVFAWNSGALVVLPAPISPEPAPFAGSWYVYNFKSPMYDKEFRCNADGTVSVLTDASEGANGGNWSATPYRWTGSSWDQVGQARHISSPVRQMAFDCRGLPRDV